MAAPHLSLALRRRLGGLGAAEIAALFERVAQGVERQVEALGPRPQGWRDLADALALARPLDATDGGLAALQELHALLRVDAAPARAGLAAWEEALATVTGAAALARLAGGSSGSAGLAAVLAGLAEACVLRAAWEAEPALSGVDAALRQQIVAQHSGDVIAQIARRWRLPPAVAAAARDAARAAEGSRCSPEALALYYARQLGAAQRAGFAAPGLEDQVVHAMGVAPAALAGVQRSMQMVPRLAAAVLQPSAGLRKARDAG